MSLDVYLKIDGETVNGFLRNTPSDTTFACLATDDIRAVRNQDGAISYFSEKSTTKKVVRLDVMQQDVHAPDYLDIDKFVTTVKDRTTAAMLDAQARYPAADDAMFKRVPEKLIPIITTPPAGLFRTRPSE